MDERESTVVESEEDVIAMITLRDGCCLHTKEVMTFNDLSSQFALQSLASGRILEVISPDVAPGFGKHVVIAAHPTMLMQCPSKFQAVGLIEN